MLRTYFQQNEDWFANSGHPFSRFGEMESEIAELKTISKVTRLRKQIECREEGAWMIVKDVPDENAPNGSRKVTTYGRTRRSVTRSVTSNSDFDNIFHENMSNEPLVQHPSEDSDSKNSKPSSVEITEVFEEPLRGNIIEVEKPDHKEVPERTKKKTSVVTLGEGNLVLIDPEKESNFHITGISKGKVADAVNTLEKTSEKKPKKVGFCKTEVHFAPDSGKINIVETDEKPPPTQVYRRKKRPRGSRRGSNSNCLPKHYFGEHDLDDSNQSNESDKEEPRPHLFPANIEPIPQVKQIFPAFEKTIKSEGKDVKYRHSSPEKSNADFGFDKQFDEKEFFRKLKQPSFRERFLRENESPSDKLTSSTYTTPVHTRFADSKYETEAISLKGSNTTVNGLISRHNQFSKDKFSNISKNENDVTEDTNKPELRYTELFKLPANNESDEDISSKSNNINITNDTEVSINDEKEEQPKYACLNKPIPLVEDKDDFYSSVPRVPIDQDVKPDVMFLGSMSPKLKSLIQNSVEHEFQLRQKQILQRRTLERKSSGNDSNKIKSSVKIRVPPDDTGKVRESVLPEESKQKPTKLVTHFNSNDESTSKHEFQIKREEITKNMFTEPLYSNKKEMPYLLNEEPIPAPREKTKNAAPPKPKPRTVTSPDRPRTKVSPRNVTGRHSSKSETSTLSKRTRSRESLAKSKEQDKTSAKTIPNRDETKTKRIVPIKIEGGLQRLTKTNVQQRKVSRGEPLRSFEKVSNGWVGVVPSTKREERETSKVNVTSKAYANKALLQQSSQHSSEMSGGEMDEMTASYTEISDGVEGLPGGEGKGGAGGGGGERPGQLELLTRLDGTVASAEGAEGQMVTFVADDLETKLRLASPRGILAALESEACALAASVDSLTESLADALHGISAMTVECLETYTSVVTKTSDAIDANIKAMYQLMAKSEELSKAMAPLYKLSGHIKNIKHLLDLIEASPS